MFLTINSGESHSACVDCEEQKQNQYLMSLPKYLLQISTSWKQGVFSLREEEEEKRICDGNSHLHLSLVHPNMGFLVNKLQNQARCN